MAASGRFTIERRERFLALLEVGTAVNEAAERVGVSRQTIANTARKGRAEEGTEDAVFARRYDSIRAGTGPLRLERSDVIRMLEAKAHDGNVIAMKALLAEFEKEQAAKNADAKPQPVAEEPSIFDEIAARRAQRA